MTREEADRLFSMIAVATETPTPPDPYLAAVVRLRMSAEIASRFREELDQATDAMAAALSRVVDLREKMSAWTSVAQAYADDAAKHAPDSPWLTPPPPSWPLCRGCRRPAHPGDCE